MARKDRDRLRVLHQVMEKKLTQRQGAAQLHKSVRWVRKLVARLREEGDSGILHRARDRPSNRRIQDSVRKRAEKVLSRAEYSDFGPTLASEYLAQQGIEVSKETTRKWMIEAGLWKAKRRRIEQVHTWRPRRSCFGELVQWDTSDHDWLEGRGPRIYLVAMIDDATSRLWAKFVLSDSTENNMPVLWEYLERFGRPVDFYTDKDSMFCVPAPLKESASETIQQDRLTQIGRALRELGIGWIAAHSPQAKGRVERCFGTLQDRLVKGMRLAGVRTLEEANGYLREVFLPEWNQRFTVEPASNVDAHRRLGEEHELAAILSHVEERQITNDYTFRFYRRSYRIAKAAVRPGMRGQRVRVERRLDGSVRAKFQGREVPISVCESSPEPVPAPPAQPRRAVRRGKGRWMKGFDLSRSQPLWQILERESGA